MIIDKLSKKCQSSRNYFLIAVIRRNLQVFCISLSLMACLFLAKPSSAISATTRFNQFHSNSIPFAALKYEIKESTSLTAPITDPNFNVMRKKELGRSMAIPLVIGVLLIAIVAPLATWWFFSK